MYISTERYDGKTRKDDVKKWTLIISLGVILFVDLQVGLHFLKKANAPDYVIVDMCRGLLKEDITERIQDTTAQVVGDKNGNGKATVSVKKVTPTTVGVYGGSDEAGGYDESTAALFTGDYVLFLMLDPSPWDDSILAERIDLTETELWESLNTPLPVYACILNTDEEQMEEAGRIIEALRDMKMSDKK